MRIRSFDKAMAHPTPEGQKGPTDEILSEMEAQLSEAVRVIYASGLTPPTPEERDPFDTHAKFHDACYAKGFADALRLAVDAAKLAVRLPEVNGKIDVEQEFDAGQQYALGKILWAIETLQPSAEGGEK